MNREGNMEIPFINLSRQNVFLKEQVISKIKEILENCQYILGEEVEKFEKEFAEFCGTKYGVGVSSGSDALFLSLKALGIKEGDKVITVPNTFVATVDAISRCGAKPSFVDIDPLDYTIDSKKIEEKITNKTKAIIPVHIYGHPANMEKITELAKKYNLHMIEDACQAHGAEYKGKKVGSIGDVGCFSFYPTKNLGCYGDGAIITTNNKEVVEKLKLLRNYGQKEKNFHEIRGYNHRLDGIQAAILRIKLRYLDRWNEKRREHAKLYNKLLENVVEIPIERSFVKAVYHLYIIRTKERDNLKDYLAKKGVSSLIHYPRSVHLQKAYTYLNHKEGDFPITEKYSKEILSLPMFPELEEKEITYIADKIKEWKKTL
jgi:dTDP-4-amino-4,6-dideoxygalactose transaminase